MGRMVPRSLGQPLSEWDIKRKKVERWLYPIMGILWFTVWVLACWVMSKWVDIQVGVE